MNTSPRIDKIDPTPDEDLSTKFMVLEGARQLPPVPTSHDDIRTQGNGRYSIWNRQVYFSPTDTARLYTQPYWIVPLNEKTERFLRFVPVRKQITEQAKQAALTEVRQFLNEPAPSIGALPPGSHIVVCTHGLSPGGAERQWVYFAQALSDAGYDVTVVTYHPLSGAHAHYLPMLEQRGIRTITAVDIPVIELLALCAQMTGMLAVLRSNIVPEQTKLMRLAAAFYKIRPKAVFAQLDEPNILAGFAAHLADVPRVVMSFRNYRPANFPYFDQSWYQKAYQFLAMSNRVLFSGNHTGANDDYAEWIGVPREKIKHIANAIDSQAFSLPTEKQVQSTRTELRLDDTTPVLLGAFRLEKEKGPLAFVDICAQVAHEFPKMRAFMVGSGSLKAEIEQRVAELGLSSNIAMLGRRSDLNVLMKLASVFVLASEMEGMPNVLMEAQLMGLPIVASRAGGTPNTVLDGETAILKSIGDVEGLSRACISLLRDKARAERMSMAGRQHALTAFPKDVMARHYLDLLRGT